MADRPSDQLTNLPTERPTDRPTDKPTDRPTAWPTYRRTDWPTYRRTDWHPNRLTHVWRRTELPTYRPTAWPTDWLAHKQTDPRMTPDWVLWTEHQIDCLIFHRAAVSWRKDSSCCRLGLKNLKTTTLTQNQARPLKPRNARKRPAESTSCFRTGYDGMGGHTKFLLPSRPSKVSNKKVSRPNTISKFIKQGTTRGREPPLPVMTLD